jgi:hypothetical protein
MREIDIPYHLIIPSVISVFCLLYIILNRNSFINKTSKIFFITLLFFLTFYLFIVGSSSYFDIYYQWKLNTFDLNNDGFFSGNEINSEQKLAMKNLISDTPRNFSFIVGLVYSFVFSAILFVFLIIFKKIGQFVSKKTAA